MSYFVYVLAKGPLAVLEPHVIAGPEDTVRRTRELVCQGAQVNELMFVSGIMPEDETYHARRMSNEALKKQFNQNPAQPPEPAQK